LDRAPRPWRTLARSHWHALGRVHTFLVVVTTLSYAKAVGITPRAPPRSFAVSSWPAAPLRSAAGPTRDLTGPAQRHNAPDMVRARLATRTPLNAPNGYRTGAIAHESLSVT